MMPNWKRIVSAALELAQTRGEEFSQFFGAQSLTPQEAAYAFMAIAVVMAQDGGLEIDDFLSHSKIFAALAEEMMPHG